MKKWWMLVALAGVGTACGDDPVAVTTAAVDVTVATVGDVVDSDGYIVLVDAVESGTVAASGTIALELDDGVHTVELTDLLDPCVVDGDNPVSITVVAGVPMSVLFDVTC